MGLTLHLIEEKYPLYILEQPDFEIEVIIRHKQRAVGYQSMVYVCLPIKNAESEEIIGRYAFTNEAVRFRLTNDKNNFVFDAFKLFSLASKKHNEDIKSILQAIKIAL